MIRRAQAYLPPKGHDPQTLRHKGLVKGRQRTARQARTLESGREVLGERGLEDRQGLPELHRAALELAEHAEQLGGGTRLASDGTKWVLTAADDMSYNEPGKVPAGRFTESRATGVRDALELAPASVTIFRSSVR